MKIIAKRLARKAGKSKMVENIREKLAGKKTYIVALGMLVAAVVQWIADNDLTKLIDNAMKAIAFMTVRAAIANK